MQPSIYASETRCLEFAHPIYALLTSVSRHALTLANNVCICHRMNTMARFKKMTSFALDPALLKRLSDWLSRQEFPPTKTAVHEAALREFLDRREEKPSKVRK